MEGDRFFACWIYLLCCISIHSLRVEGDSRCSVPCCSKSDFNPLPPCGGRQEQIQQIKNSILISIHSLRVEGDLLQLIINLEFFFYFNPLPPCGGRRYCANWSAIPTNFNPLPPCGGRRRNEHRLPVSRNISIHSLRVEGDSDYHFHHPPIYISIHSLRVEGDHTSQHILPSFRLFQSTPSVWRETLYRNSAHLFQMISIHSLRVEGDPFFFSVLRSINTFQSTPSVWRETGLLSSKYGIVVISIHSLRVEGDC